MKLVFVAGLLDIINKPICDEIYALLGDDFRFIASVEKTELRKDYMTGYNNTDIPYLVIGYDPNNKDEVDRLIEECDVVLFSSGLEKDALKRRLKSEKITIRATERLYKEPFTFKNLPRRIVSIIIHHGIYQQKSNYVFCSGNYVAEDFRLFHCYGDRMYQWGYFTESSSKSYDELMDTKRSDVTEILWAGRFVHLKHPELVIDLAESLLNSHYQFHITMLGGGDEFETIKNEICTRGLQDVVSLEGYKNHDEVVSFMEKADIYLFTSDRNEGWGAVVQEAMGCACATVASIEAGVTNSVINNHESGLTFTVSDKESLFKNVKLLLDDDKLRRTLSENGYYTIRNVWSPRSAAKRLVEMVNALVDGKSFDKYEDGPCSKA